MTRTPTRPGTICRFNSIAIINLKETGYHNELGNGFWYGKLQTKLTESLLAKYHRWVFETQTPESVFALKTWVFQESAFQTIASETVHGITGTFRNSCSQSAQASPTCNNQRTFFGVMMERYSINDTACQICSRITKSGPVRNSWKRVYLNDGIQRSVSSYVLDV